MAMATLASGREPKRYVDFAAVPPSQWKMHDRLENWARWCRGASGESARAGDASPMFSLYRSGESQQRRYGEETSVPIDKDDALKIHFAIVHPTFHPKCRKALQWSYLRPRDPKHEAWKLGVSLQGLANLVAQGRQLLIESGV
jgi:hypothetical protein